jgi:threonyl-tRNA synthetase
MFAVYGVTQLAGELELWNKAEAALEEALNSTGREWVMNPGDGAFYGPKIDITGALQHVAVARVVFQLCALHTKDACITV